MSLTDAQRGLLQEINLKYNAIPYDAITGEHEPSDWWTDAPVVGQSWVCRDYVLAKAKALGEAGWPPASMTVVLCWTEPPQSEYHAVLAVETSDPSPMILDSRFDQIYRMDAPLAAYTWDKRQVAGSDTFEQLGSTA